MSAFGPKRTFHGFEYSGRGATKRRFPMDEFSITSANLDQIDQDFLAREVPDEIMEAAGEAVNICRMTFGGWPSTTAACCNPG